MRTSAYVSYVIVCQHTSAYVSIRQYTSSCVSIRQHTSAYVSLFPGAAAGCVRELKQKAAEALSDVSVLQVCVCVCVCVFLCGGQAQGVVNTAGVVNTVSVCTFVLLSLYLLIATARE